MVWDLKDGALSEHDWRVLGHTYIPKHGSPTLPTRRLDIPLPATADGLHTLSLRLQELSNALHQVARQKSLGTPNRSCILEAMMLLDLYRKTFKALREDWETELPEEQPTTVESAGNREPLRLIGGTGEAT